MKQHWKRFLAGILTAVLLLGALPVQAMADPFEGDAGYDGSGAGGEPAPLAVEDLTVTGGTLGTDYSYADGVLTVLTGTALTVSSDGTATSDRIDIADGVEANVTIENLSIDTTGGNAIRLGDGRSTVLGLAAGAMARRETHDSVPAPRTVSPFSYRKVRFPTPQGETDYGRVADWSGITPHTYGNEMEVPL